jgi:hypothetical protein
VLARQFAGEAVDLVVRDADGNLLGAIGVKAGGSRYRAWQRAKDEYLKRIHNIIVVVVRM